MKAKIALVAFLVSMFFLPAAGRSALVTSQEATAVGEAFIDYMITKTGGWGDATAAGVGGCKELKRGDLLLGYHLPVDPRGHIVVSILNDLPPVKSFSFTNDFETESEEGYWLLLKDTMEQTLLFIQDHYGPLEDLKGEIAPHRNRENWDWLMGSAAPPDRLTQVGPLIETSWHQRTPFKNNCPMGDGGRCVVGCVATAASQIMKYWDHPAYGKGDHSYYWDGDQSCGGSTPGQVLSADFSDSYDWANMLNSYSGGYNSTQAAAVAELCYEVGVAFEMDYGYCGSGAYTYDGLDVYPDYFRYQDTMTKQDRSGYPSADAWFDRIKTEFDAAPPRPIHYRIYAHSILCDGYRENGTDYIHMNYGWADGHNAWYAVDNLYCDWPGCSYLQEYMLCGIQPDPGYTVTIHANYVGFNYPDGHGSPQLNEAPVIINGVPGTTPVETVAWSDTPISVGVPGWAQLYKSGAHFGQGPYDCWSDGGAQTHQVTITSDTTLTVYFNPDLISTRGCCGIVDAIDDWAEDGDTVLVGPGTCHLGSGDTPVMIVRPLTLISESGNTTISTGGCSEIIRCDDVSGVRIGDIGHGFTFEPESGIGDYIYAEDCNDVYIVDNDFDDGGVPDYRDIDGGVSIRRCRDVEITSNQFPYGWLYAIDAASDTNLTIASNTVYYDWEMGTQRRGWPRIVLSSCRDAGIYGTTLVRYESEPFPGIKLSSCYGDIVIGGDLDHGNKLPYADVFVFGSAPLRIDGECNYWGWSNYDALINALYDQSQGHLDFVPWANSSLTQTYVPFSGSQTSVGAPDSSAVCPAGDLDWLGITLTVRDGGGDPVEDMWCDDVEIEWADEHPEDASFQAPNPCESKTLFDEKTTDANGRATADWTEMGGCGTITVSAIENITLANPGVAFVNSPDFNADRVVDLSDFGTFAQIYLTDEICGDFNRDGVVELSDFGTFAGHYLHGCPEALGGGYVVDLESDTAGRAEARLRVPFDGVDEADPSYTADLTLAIDPGSYEKLRGLEVLVSYDKRSARPLRWDTGSDLYIMTLEAWPHRDTGRGVVRIASVAAEAIANGAGEYRGTLRFAVDDAGAVLEPRLESVRGLTAENQVIDLIGSIGVLSGGGGAAGREYVVTPTLEVGRNPSAEPVSLRFGAPLSHGRHLRVSLYDVRGRLVRTVYDASNDGVLHTAEIGLRAGSVRIASPGVYFVRFHVDGRVLNTRKIVLLK